MCAPSLRMLVPHPDPFICSPVATLFGGPFSTSNSKLSSGSASPFLTTMPPNTGLLRALLVCWGGGMTGVLLLLAAPVLGRNPNPSIPERKKRKFRLFQVVWAWLKEARNFVISRDISRSPVQREAREIREAGSAGGVYASLRGCQVMERWERKDYFFNRRKREQREGYEQNNQTELKRSFLPKIGKRGGEGESGPKEPFCFCTNFAFPTEDKLKSNLSTKFIGTVELSVFFSLSIPIPTLLRISADASGDGDSDGDSDGSLLGCRALDDAANKTLRLSSPPQPWLELEVRPPKVRCPPPILGIRTQCPPLWSRPRRTETSRERNFCWRWFRSTWPELMGDNFSEWGDVSIMLRRISKPGKHLRNTSKCSAAVLCLSSPQRSRPSSLW